MKLKCILTFSIFSLLSPFRLVCETAVRVPSC